jgi:hypothetical protein
MATVRPAHAADSKSRYAKPRCNFGKKPIDQTAIL